MNLHSVDGQKITVEQLRQLIDESDQELYTNTQLSFAMIDNKEITHCGILVDNDSIVQIDNADTLFEIGSLSKIVVSSVFAKMVNENRLHPSDKVYKHLKYKSLKSKDLRLEHILNHTSGLPRLPSNMDLQSNLMDPYASYDQQKFDEYLKKECQLTTEPGKQFEYSNIGMAVLVEILKKKTKKDYDDLLHTYIFDPLHMDNTYSYVEKAPLITRGMGPNGQRMNNWHFKSLAAAGSIISSSKDLAKLAYSYIHETNTYQPLMESTFQLSENMNMGMGWFLLKKDDHTILYHNGRTGGYSSCMVIDLTNKKAVVVLSNISGLGQQADLIDVLGLRLLDL